MTQRDLFQTPSQRLEHTRRAARRRELAIAAARSAVTVLEGCYAHLPDGEAALQRARQSLARAMERQP